MSDLKREDVNKIVAAILTAGRVPTMKHDGTARPTNDWLAEYEMWLGALSDLDDKDRKRKAKAHEERILRRSED